MTHHVSAAATESFWKVAKEFIPELNKVKENSENNRKIPGFKHIRRQIHADTCPPIEMKFIFLNKTTNAIEEVNCKKSPPRKQFPRENCTKLYEEAHIKVN